MANAKSRARFHPLGFLYVRQVRAGKEASVRWPVLDYKIDAPRYGNRTIRRLPNGRNYALLVFQREPDPDGTSPTKRNVYLFISDLTDLPEVVEGVAEDLGISVSGYHLADA